MSNKYIHTYCQAKYDTSMHVDETTYTCTWSSLGYPEDLLWSKICIQLYDILLIVLNHVFLQRSCNGTLLCRQYIVSTNM